MKKTLKKKRIEVIMNRNGDSLRQLLSRPHLICNICFVVFLKTLTNTSLHNKFVAYNELVFKTRKTLFMIRFSRIKLEFHKNYYKLIFGTSRE